MLYACMWSRTDLWLRFSFTKRNDFCYSPSDESFFFLHRQIFVCSGCSIYGGTIADSYRDIRIGGGIKPVPWKRILISPWTVTLFNRVVSAIFVCNAKANASIDVFRCSMFPHVEVVIQRDSYNTGARNIFVIFRRGERETRRTWSIFQCN